MHGKDIMNDTYKLPHKSLSTERSKTTVVTDNHKY